MKIIVHDKQGPPFTLDVTQNNDGPPEIDESVRIGVESVADALGITGDARPRFLSWYDRFLQYTEDSHTELNTKIQHLQQKLDARDQRVRTHDAECWRRHIECAEAKVEGLQRALVAVDDQRRVTETEKQRLRTTIDRALKQADFGLGRLVGVLKEAQP